MSKRNKIEALNIELRKEEGSEQPDINKIKKLRGQIMALGLGLTGRDIIKPY